MSDYGEVNYQGKQLKITQQPYPDGTSDAPVYRASAEDSDGSTYRVMWPMTDPDADDGADACDWDDYTVEAESK
jgi:hypothetical protein